MRRMPKSKKMPNTKNTKKRRDFKFRYSFFTLVLLLCLVHVGVGAFYNISKNINLGVKIKKMEQLKLQAMQENIRLKEELDKNSLDSLEAIARNNLKMAGEKEVLVIFNKKAEPTPPPKNLDKNNKKNKFRMVFEPRR